MNQAPFHLVSIEELQGKLYKMKGFYRMKARTIKLLAKGKDCFRQGFFSLGGRAESLIMQITSSAFGEWRGPKW